MELLSRATSMSARELAEAAGVGEKRARAALRRLVAEGHVRAFKAGRAMRYCSAASGARPEIGLPERVAVLVAAIDRAAAETRAAELIKTRLFGLLDDAETVHQVELLWRPLYQVEIEERIEKSFLGKLVGPDHEDVRATIYLHPSTLLVATFTEEDGIRFAPRPAVDASAIDDFDGRCRFDDVPPATLAIDDPAWTGRRSVEQAADHVRATFAATPRAVQPVFVPLWRLLFQPRDAGHLRVLLIDALAGRPVDWPPG